MFLNRKISYEKFIKYIWKKDDGEIVSKSGILTNSGDRFKARIIASNRRVVKVQKENGIC